MKEMANTRPLRTKPFPQRTPFGREELAQVQEALETQNLFSFGGRKVVTFEKRFAQKYGTTYAVASTSGTAAIHLAVAALDLEPGREVITAPVTDFGTIAGLIFQGCVPVFADWSPGGLNMDPRAIEHRITRRTAAIIVVHLFGNPCDMDPIMRIARRHKLPVIEDCCQAYCTPYKGRWVGGIGDIGCFSLQGSKHMNAGEGGITITRHRAYAMRMCLFRDKGWENRGQWGPRAYTFLGMNYRMNELTAAVALAQLRKVEDVVRKRRRLGARLTECIRDVQGIHPAPVTPGGAHSYWLYPFRVTGFDAETFIKALRAEGIPAAWGYTGKPIYLCHDALRRQKTFGSSGYPFRSPYYRGHVQYGAGLCPVAEKELTQIGTLPLHENWTDREVRDTANAFHKVAKTL